jgi:hypothetical protein
MTLNYQAQVETEKKGLADFTYTRSYDTSGLAATCWLTFWIYGGTCWGYLFRPTNGDQDEFRSDAESELATQIQGRYEIRMAQVVRTNWSSESTSHTLNFERAIATKAERTDAPAPTSVEEFEKSIPEKITREERAKSSDPGFPPGWPEKWFYETEGYKYWTIVGEKARTAAESMILSKKKADQVISAEFPKLMNSLKYETTHNEVKRIDGKFESWRVIRVRQRDLE